MVELRLLGCVDLTLNGAPAPQSILTRPKDLALLSFLALATPRGFQRRDTLLAYFWPESDEAHARGALNQSLYRLRHALGEGLLVARGTDEVGLDWSKWRCDAVELRAAAAARDHEAVVRLYRGELLSGFHADTSPEFEQWLDAERNDACDAAARAALDLAARAANAGDSQAAVEYRRRALSFKPFDEDILQQLMEALQRCGDSQTALAEYQRFAARLAAELGTEPAAATHLLAARIRDSMAITAERRAPAQTPKVPNAPVPRRARRRALIAISATVSVLVVTGALLLRATDFRAARTDVPTQIVIADFVNRTGEPHLAAAIAEALGVDLSQSTIIRPASAVQVAATLRRMGRDSLDILSAADAREVAIRDGIKVVLRGEVSALGAGYLISAQVITADSGRVLVSVREQAADARDVITAVDRLSDRLRRRMGDSLRGKSADRPLEAVTTSSLEALKLYSAGLRMVRFSDMGDGRSSGGLPGRVRPDDRAVSLFEQAVALDSTFASAYRALGVHMYWLAGERTRVSDLLTRAFNLRHRLTDRERLHTEGTYYHFVTGEYDRAIACFEQLLERDAKDFVAIQHLGHLYFRRQDFARAVDMYERDWRLRGGAPALLYTSALLGAGRIARADSILQYYAALDSSGGLWHGELIRLRAGLGDFAAVDTLLPRMLALAQKSAPNVRAQAIRMAGMLKVWRGGYDEGVALLESAWGTNSSSRPLGLELNVARFDVYVLHDPARARRRLEAALARTQLEAIPQADRPYVFLSSVYAHAGDYKRAMEFARASRHVPLPWTPANSAATNSNLYTTEAMASASRGDIESARRIVANAEREIGCWYGTQWVHLTRARVEETAGDPDSVIAALERLVAVPSCGLTMSWSDLWGPVSQAYGHERLGQLYDARGDARRAAEHYARFVALWPDPDPLLRARWLTAKERLTQLQREGSS